MAKFTHDELKNYLVAKDLLETYGKLPWYDRLDVFRYWRPSASDVTQRDSFFTPWEVAYSVSMDGIDSGTVLDLGAGIGVLGAMHLYNNVQGGYNGRLSIVAVESNPEFVRVGKKVFPEAEWIEHDVLDPGFIDSLGKFDLVISNPPYSRGKIQKWLEYQGPLKSLQFLEVALRVSDSALFILPSSLLPYKRDPSFHAVFSKHWDKFKRAHPKVLIGPSNFVVEEHFNDTNIETDIVRLYSPSEIVPANFIWEVYP